MSRVCLVVDDSPTVRRVLRRILTGLGFETSEAADGQQALAACRMACPAIIFLDWNMPVMDGIGFLQALRREQLAEPPAVIFCTTVSELAHIEEALEAGASAYIMKPFDEGIVRMKLGHAGLL